jgi:hypothetical protein
VPELKSFSVLPRRMVVTVRGKHERTRGETFRYALDQAATVLIVVEQQLPGRLAGKRCVAATRRFSRARRCVRYLVAKIITVKNAKAGNGRFHYAGLAGKRLLSNGDYRALGVAVNAAGWSKTRSASYTVAGKRLHRAGTRRS